MNTQSNSLDFAEYNWDDISTGDFETNNSLRFFGRRHVQHERNPEKFEEMINENEFHLSNLAEVKEMNDENDFNLDNLTEYEPNEDVTALADEINQSNDSKKQENARPLDNIRREDKTSKSKLIATNKPKDFEVVQYQHLYEAKRKGRQAYEERRLKELRSFQAKPCPNFRAIHAKAQEKYVQVQIPFTVPTTPLVVQRHHESTERLRKKKEEMEAAQAPRPFKSNDNPSVLRTKPFVPKATKKATTEPMPFKLHGAERSKERRHFDEEIRAESERKAKEEEDARQRQEEQIRRELRKATTFKAQPNPFGSGTTNQ